MNLSFLLLRLILIASLALNGASAAASSATMAMDHAMQANSQLRPATAAESAPAMASCHDAHGKGATAVAVEPGTSDASHHAGKSPDCCKSKVCHCAGTMYASMAFAIQNVPPPEFAAALYAGSVSLSHSEPRLAHLIRPPIG